MTDELDPAEAAELCPLPGCDKPAGHRGFHRGPGNTPGRGGRGRPPKPAGASSEEPPAPKASRPRVVNLPRPGLTAREALVTEAGEIAEDLQARVVVASGPFAPVVAGKLASDAEANTRAVMAICRQHPRFLQAVLKAALYDAYIQLGTSALGLAVAAGVEARLLIADGKLAEGFGVTEIWERVQAERDEAQAEVASHYRVGASEPPAPPGGLMAEL